MHRSGIFVFKLLVVGIVVSKHGMSVLILFRGNRLEIHSTRSDVDLLIRLLEPSRCLRSFNSQTDQGISRCSDVCDNSPLLHNLKVRSAQFIKYHVCELIGKSY
jgi:hypothetical protein